MADEPRMLGGRYELGPLLGRGGMAQVRRARDIRLGRQVAVKLLRIDLAGDPTFQARFRREAQASAGLNHPNIVAVYDTGEEADPDTGVSVPYIVMELVEGHTLRELLRDGRKILPERALEFTAGVLDALAYSHRAGIVHRDIKPANVMLTGAGQIKVMDFGIARAVADTSATMTQTAAVIGTAQYLSPEQARGETVDARSDIYSTGCLLYELLVGHPPFRGDSPVSVVYQHVREQPVPPSKLDSLVSDDMDAIVLKALAKDAGDRYQSASEMRDDINRLLAGQAILAVAPAPEPAPTSVLAATQALESPGEPTEPTNIATIPQRAVDQQKRRRNPWIWGVVAFLAVLGLGFGTYYIFNPEARIAQVEVPNVTQRSQDWAEQQLTDAQLQVVVKPIVGADDDTVGRVVSQNPPGGVKVPVGTTVTIQVNVGPKKAMIPTDLIGMTASEAEKSLKALGFSSVKQMPDAGNTGKPNTVTNVSPSPGLTVTVDSPIILYVVPGTGIVPNFLGQNRAAAQAQADREGWDVTFTEEETTAQPEGNVFKQDPTAGEEIKRSQKIVLVLAKTPSTPSTPPDSVSPSPTPSKSND